MSCLVLAIAETNLWAHYLIDGGERLSWLALAFILIVGLGLFRRRGLFVSLPLVFPWLLYPVITQGDQIIDHLSINAMRIVCHALLAAIFAAPVAVVVLAARYAFGPKPGRPPIVGGWRAYIPGLRRLSEGQTRKGMAIMAAVLFAGEVLVAYQFLGTLMVGTLLLLMCGALACVPRRPFESLVKVAAEPERRERFALVVLLLGVAASLALHIGYKNRAGTYQGSPSAFMDPSLKKKGYPLDRIAVPARPPAQPASPEMVQQALISYARTLERLLAGYHILDRGYTYDFHNQLFLRHTPLLKNYRAAGLEKIEEARGLRTHADARAKAARATLTEDDPLAALLDDLREYVAFNFNRAPMLEAMSGQFETTPAGLQHAAHLYEGESKALGTHLDALLKKHSAVLNSPVTAPVTSELVSISRLLYEAYARHVVGF